MYKQNHNKLGWNRVEPGKKIYAEYWQCLYNWLQMTHDVGSYQKTT